MDRYEFEDALAQVREATVSTHAFAEDSLAGLNTAIDKLDWEPYHGRVIFLLTDAGPLPTEDPFNSIPATPETIFEKAKAKNIKIVPIHIKSPSGKHNHMLAERAYKSLSFEGGGRSNYFDIEAPSGQAGAEVFWAASDQIFRSMEAQIFSQPRGSYRQAPKNERQSPIEQRAADLGAVLGNSIRLDYLGARNKARSPRVVRSWIPDQDLSNLDSSEPRRIRTVDVAVLLTKNQLSALARQLNIIVTNAEKVMTEQSDDFFRNILAASAQISRDPGRFSLTPQTRLGDLGGLAEFLDDLPYKSKIMGMTEADWYNMSPGEQDSFVRAIKARLNAYDDYDRDVDNWAKFDPRNDGEWLYRVPLNMLP
jgi:serine/threonine-protein kinase PpkA